MRILHLEDNPPDALLVAGHLRQNGIAADIHVVADPHEMQQAIQDGEWDAVLMDYTVLGPTPLVQTAEIARLLPDTPLILVAEAVGPEMVVETVKNGVWDFVLKGRLARLIPSLQRALNESAVRRSARRAEEELRRTNERLTKVLAIQTVGVMFWDLTAGRMTDANDTFLTLTGYSRAEVLAGELTWQKLTPPEYVALSLAEIHRLYDCGRIGPYEKEYIRKDGTRSWFVFAGSRLGENECVEFCVDISAHKQVEEDLRASQRAAEAANVAKSAFLANMSHELRTPLHQITMLAELLRRDPLSARQASYLDKLGLSGKRLTGIIDAILKLTEIEARQLTLVDEPIDVGQLLADVVAMFRDEAEARGLALVVDGSAPALPPRLLGDASNLSTALHNYIVNALRFTEAGGVFLNAQLVAEDADSVVLRFEVEDTGIGIAPDALPRLFSIFEQVDNTSTRKYCGAGLGLAMTKKLAQLMGGDTGCESTPGVGSTFWFTVRLRKA